MRKEKEINEIKKRIVPILRKNNIKKAGIFGSYARGEQKRGSDVDIIIEPPKDMGIAFFGVILELEKRLGKKVDLLTYRSVHPYLKKYILGDEIRII
ncbi:nucleotidyltransferase family protein [Candidatus Pacearchaeota archaeon]|nr:nucleotidyltransferase family protein [Candidatus Pacearchaeota archaeon]